MKAQRLLILLVLVNLALLIFTLAQMRSAGAADHRARAPSVKIGASEQAAGISLAGPSNTKQTNVILEAKGTATSLRLKNEDGREQTVAP